MPPLPATFDEETRTLIDSIGRRQNDVKEFQIPRLQACKGPLSVQQSYANGLREDLETLARQLEALDIMVEDQRSDRDRRTLSGIVHEFRENLSSLRKSTRSALLSSKRAMDSQSASNRELLLRTSTKREKGTEVNEKGATDDLMKANDDVTEALRRTIGIMQGELERSVLSSQMLEQSSATLRSTSTTYDTLDMVLGTSKQLVTALEKSDWMDRLLIIFALIFFFLVVALIVKQRIVDRGLRIALWWTRFLPHLRSPDEVLKNLEKGELLATATAISSTIATTSSSLSGSISSFYSDGLLDVVATSSQSVPTLSTLTEMGDSPTTETESGVHDEL